MMKDCIPAALITVGLYTIQSFLNPLHLMDTHILDSFRAGFNLTPLLLIPAAVILLAPLVKMNIKLAMGISIFCASVLAFILQKMTVRELLHTLILGYEANDELSFLLSGGGVRSMIHSCLMIMVSATFSGIFNGTNMLSEAEQRLEKLSEKLSLFRVTVLTSFPIIMFSCNQTLAVMLHVALIRPI